MAGRTIAVGDIHGCADALAALVAAVHPTPADTLVPLGDVIDRGLDRRTPGRRPLIAPGRWRL